MTNEIRSCALSPETLDKQTWAVSRDGSRRRVGLSFRPSESVILIDRLRQLEAAELEWQSIPCYRRYLYDVTGGRMGDDMGDEHDCGACHVCIRREAIRQSLDAMPKGK